MPLCDHCGEDKEDVGVRIDPFIREIYPEDITEDNPQTSAWCEQCYDTRRDDI
jgi:hypothetical protein